MILFYIPPTEFRSLSYLIVGQAEIDAVKSAIMQFWPNGIQDMRPQLQDPKNPKAPTKCFKFKLLGNPFCVGDKMTAIQSRKLTSCILSSMYNLGWKVSFII